MKVFRLPDLGEGLPDAVIREWHVKVGDTIKVDQPLVAMETAKALVDVPAPYGGKVEKLFGNSGDTIETGHPLIGFEGEEVASHKKDAGTVVGKIEASEKVMEASKVDVLSASLKPSHPQVKVLPAVRLLAKELGVDLTQISPKGDHITVEDVKQAAMAQGQFTAGGESKESVSKDWTPLSMMSRAMSAAMSRAHAEVVPVTLTDDADLHAWKSDQNVTIRLIRAIQVACEREPMLNVHFDGVRVVYKKNETINLGLAVDTEQGLYVPVLKDIKHTSNHTLREQIERFKSQARTHSIPAADLKDATIALSNFGSLAGRYATPIVVPPMVAIIGIGRTREVIVPKHGQPAIHRILPLSVTADHRIITGGQIARFLRALIDSLEMPTVLEVQ